MLRDIIFFFWGVELYVYIVDYLVSGLKILS